MDCENYLCVYENHGKCRLESISLDISGQCTNCIYVTLTEQEIEKAKKRTLKSTEEK